MCFGRTNAIVLLVESIDDWKNSGKLFIKQAENLQLLGLDLEWVDNGKAALMQLALPDGTCLLIRLHLLNGIPPELKDVLQRSDVIKLGVGIKQDGKKLLKDYGIVCNSWVDIRHIVKLRRPYIRKLGMGGIPQDILKITLDKDCTIRASNWEDGECDGGYSQRQI